MCFCNVQHEEIIARSTQHAVPPEHKIKYSKVFRSIQTFEWGLFDTFFRSVHVQEIRGRSTQHAARHSIRQNIQKYSDVFKPLNTFHLDQAHVVCITTTSTDQSSTCWVKNPCRKPLIEPEMCNKAWVVARWMGKWIEQLQAIFESDKDSKSDNAIWVTRVSRVAKWQRCRVNGMTRWHGGKVGKDDEVTTMTRMARMTQVTR